MNKTLEKPLDDYTLDFNNMSPENTRRLNSIAREIRKEYTEFVDDCCRKYGNNHLFWATPFASRNVFNDSDTFLMISRLFLTVELVEKGSINRVITEYLSEAKVLSGHFDTISVESVENDSIRTRMRQVIRNKLDFVGFLVSEIKYILYSINEDKNESEYDSIVISPVLSSGFKDYQYNDRYFTGITKVKKVAFVPLLNNNSDIAAKDFIKKIKYCENYNFILPFKYLRVKDLKDIISYFSLVNWVKNDIFVFRSFDISPIIMRCLEKGKYNIPAYKGILIHKLIRRMAITGVKVKHFVIWYEGRPSEVMMAGAIREFYPNSGCVGYEGYPLEDINSGAFVSNYQHQSGYAPKIMAIPGKMYEENAKIFCDDVRIVYAPILRNNYEIKRKQNSFRVRKRILVVLPYFLDIARQLLIIIGKYMEFCEDSVEILIKNHPVYDEYDLTDYDISEICYNYTFVRGDLNACLDQVDIVITAATTSTLEVVYKGIQLIVLFPEGKLGSTALPSMIEKKYCSVVYSDKELFEAVDMCLSRHRYKYQLPQDIVVEKMDEYVEVLFS